MQLREYLEAILNHSKMPINTTSNDQLDRLRVKVISRASAKRIVLACHYMKTFPQGAMVCLGIMDGDKCVGVCVLGHSSATTAKVEKLVYDISKSEFLEMQRLWISDRYGHNSESRVLSLVMKLLKAHGVKLVVTHAGGCKNDCGIVYQASGWLYFGRTRCRDFYLTKVGEYKSLVAAMRFGRVKTKGRELADVGFELFGAGELIDSWRYLYSYPIDKGMRRRLTKLSQTFPKESSNYRFNQEWVKGRAQGCSADSFASSGSIP